MHTTTTSAAGSWIERGDLHASQDEEGEVDCLVHGCRAVFDRIVSGTSHIYAAWVRNELRAEGDVRLARLIQRIMPGPPGAHHPRKLAHERKRSA